MSVDNKKKLRNKPGLSLQNLLKRRKISIERFMKDFGIVSYAALSEKCGRLGVLTPAYDDLKHIFSEMPSINDPSDGIVVLPVPQLIDDKLGKSIDGVDDESDHERSDVVVIVDEQDLDISLSNASGEHVWPLKKKKTKVP